ncbi:structure-specific endonuclease subunit [Canna indica]|uniref:Structure-specific endonuclease subunit SLX1 homolog n=1 Tax=Canna indica TaxID=4628 RepID=A0AAQ3JV51_9LILI|nr:structure-specific endonuclease subunit [Canna indica]
MRARKGRAAEASTVEKSSPEEERNDFGETNPIEKGSSEEEKGFFACYLLASLSPRHKGRTYIGFTVNPRRRIRQHNGEIRCGAWRTKKGRPWEMALCIYGFPSNVSALQVYCFELWRTLSLQFEWAWQHPRESLAVRKAASSFKSLSGLANKIKIAHTMLSLPAWENLNLTVNFFSTKYKKYTAGCPKLPKQMRTMLCIMDELPCYIKGPIFDDNIEEDGDDDDDNDDDDDDNQKEVQNSTCMDVSVDHVEVDVNHVQMTSKHDFDIWRNHDDFRHSMELGESPCSMESPKATEEPFDNELGVANLMEKKIHGDLNLWKGFSETTKAYCLIESPKPDQEDSRTSRDIISRVSCSEVTFEFLEQNNLESFRQQCTPKSSNKKASSDCFLLSPDSNVIDLVTPSSFLVGSCRNKHMKTTVHMDIIDLTDSPFSL